MGNNTSEPSSSIDINKINAEHGFNGAPLYEPSNTVIFNNSVSEKVYFGDNNTWIVLGRDRNSDLTSGFSGKGHSKAGAIDIVVGRLSAVDARSIANKKVNPSFSADAARIYISQKTILDQYLLIGNKSDPRAFPCSGIALKADDIRIVARNSLKLVTRTDSLLSVNKPPYDTIGIQLIANNDDSNMQPLVLGTNLEFAFRELADRMQDIIAHVGNFIELQKKFNDKISDHTHFSPFYAKKTSLDPKVLTEAKKAAIKTYTDVEDQFLKDTNNLISWISKYLIDGGEKYINSKYNFTN